MSKLQTMSEIVERIKDIISHEIDGTVRDYHVANAINIGYTTLRTNKVKNRESLKEIAVFCYKRDLVINDIVF